MKITINTPDRRPSWIKLSPRQSSELAGSAEIAANPAKTLEKVLVRHGQVFHVKDAHIDRDSHIKIVFSKPAEFKLRGKIYTWPEAYLYSKHCTGYPAIASRKVVAAIPFSTAGSSKLIVPCTYRSQVDNSGETGQGPGWRQCASTSAVMLLETAKGLDWLNRTTKGFAQPEDWYTTQLTKRGFDTTDPLAHVSMLDSLGVPVTFRFDCSISDLNNVLDRGFVGMAGVQWKAGGHYVAWNGRDLVSGDYFWLDPYGLRAFDGDDPIDEYVTIGSGGDSVRLSMKKVQNVWLDLGDKAGWMMYPKDGTYGFNYQKPVVRIAPAKKDLVGDAIRAMAHPQLPKEEVADLIKACNEWLPKFDITTRERIIHFFAQCAHESMGFYWLEEQGDNAYFTKMYEGRADLGNTEPGDGARFSGHGLIQVTGRANHANVAAKTGIDCVNNPKLLAEYPGALVGALVWWQDNGMNALCDGGLDDADVIAVTKRINGGTNGLNDRLNRTDKLKLIVI